MNKSESERQQAWARLIRAQRVLLERVENDLKTAGFPPLLWYDVLLELERAEGSLRQYELGQQMLLSKHNLSRLLDRMQLKKLLIRETCEEDRRGSSVRLLPAGRELRLSMWPVYSAAIDEIFDGRVSQKQVREFSNTLKSLLS